jgi:LPXTG-site transpeptidase (sortase) family protein
MAQISLASPTDADSLPGNNRPGEDDQDEVVIVPTNPDDPDDPDDPSDPGRPATPVLGFLIPVTGFAPEKVTPLSTDSKPAYAATDLRIEIPSANVNLPIVGVDRKDGDWDVSWLHDQAGWLSGTSYPTWSGNSVLTAHSVNTDGKPGVFSKLKYLAVGEYVFVYSDGYRYTYKVVSNELVQPTDTSVMKHEDKSFLTLVTCDTFDEGTNAYLLRVAVRAALVDVAAIK